MSRLARLALLVALVSSAPSHAEHVVQPAERSLTIVPFPFLFYQDETKLGGGGSLNFITRRQVEGARSENSGIILVVTEREQYSVAAEFERFFDDETWHVNTMVGYEEFPADYFGLGNDTPEDGSEVFTPRGLILLGSVEYQFSGRWRTGPRVEGRTREIVERVDGGLLESDRPNGWQGADTLTLGWSLVHDGRDHVFYPRRGWWMRIATDVSATVLGSDDSFTAHTLDVRGFRSISEHGRGAPILAARFVLNHTMGSPPFDRLPELGGANLLRGFFGGRFRERTLVAAQTEVRVGHWKRLGGVVFASAGRVAPGLGAMSFAELHFAYGLGLRVQLSQTEKLHVRADLGFSDEGGTGFYLNFQEAF